MRKGFVLTIILALLGLLTFMAIYFLKLSSQNKQVSRNTLLSAQINLLVKSGTDYQIKRLSQSITIDATNQEVIDFKDNIWGTSRVAVSASDLNGCININDGINAGALEVAQENKRNAFENYFASALDPYPNNDIRDPIELWSESGSKNNHDNYEEARSALLNLRLRRLLNAYGDAHRHVALAYTGDLKNMIGELKFVQGEGGPIEVRLVEETYHPGKIKLPTPSFSTHAIDSSDGMRGRSMPGERQVDLNNYNNGLGDRIIEARPSKGYQSLEEIREIINKWSQDPGIELPESYLNEGTFFDLVSADLTVISFEDDQFFRLDDEKYRIGDFAGSAELALSLETQGDFIPRDLQLDPPNFSNMWLDHSVPLINLNAASTLVKAAVFYAPTNVSYSCESATTIPPYLVETGSTQRLDSQSSLEAMMASPSIGVAGPVFEFSKRARENGHDGDGREGHLMSLYDALFLAYYYDQQDIFHSFSPGRKNLIIRNFDDFLELLKGFNNREFKLHLTASEYNRAYEKKSSTPLYSYATGENLNFNGFRHFFISEYDERSIFNGDYIEKTLPHILSCVRRIPSYLGAPIALQSPYIMLKPQEEYALGELCRQPFRKIEDFVWRFTHPKVCFLPCGTYEVKSKAEIKDHENQLLADKALFSTVEVFKTKHYRSQKDFLELTDWSDIDPAIKIGPEFIDLKDPEDIKRASPHLGFVGLNDFEDDLELDRLYEEGFSPQIVLNFNPNLSRDETGYENKKFSNFRHQNPQTDPWLGAVHEQYPDMTIPYLNSSLEGGSTNQFGDFASEDLNDLCPFGGVRLSSLKHGEFAENTLNDSLYWRLDNWLSSGIAGQDLSSGLMVFWFQIPSGYDFPCNLRIDDTLIEPVSFTRVLASLNLWESYQYNDLGDTHERPVALTVGLKKTAQRGLNLFLRYDSGGTAPHESLPAIPFIAPPSFTLTPSNYALQNEQYDFLGVWSYSDNLAYNDHNAFNYENYRYPANRSSEVSVNFKNEVEAAPGTWHRAYASWNFRWKSDPLFPTPDDLNNMAIYNQLYIDLLDVTNKSLKQIKEYENKEVPFGNPFYQNTQPAPSGYLPQEPIDYPRNSANPGNMGFCMPFNPTPILSLGESHSVRFNEMRLEATPNYRLRYAPFWRCDSIMDNFRLYMGPSQSIGGAVGENYFKPGYFLTEYWLVSSLYKGNTQKRYHIENTRNLEDDKYLYHQPYWPVNLEFLIHSQLLSFGTRIYYPPLKSTSVIKFGLEEDVAYFQKWNLASSKPPKIKTWDDMSKNEQNFFFVKKNVPENLRLVFQYSAFSPDFNGDYFVNGHSLKSFGVFQPGPKVYSGGNFTNIPWIKEISLRYIPPSGSRILKTTTKD